jgi:aryl-alcohol dehydrogenase-like predicted oxidoreductase
MNKRKLGRTNLQVSELCLNATKLGWVRDEEASLALLDAYRAEGGNFLQTLGFCPNSTSDQPWNSGSEELVGRWHQSRAIPRESLVLATRVNLFRPMHGGSIMFSNLIRESCESSIRRLQVKHLDLLVCEWNEQLIPLADVIEAFDQLIRAGLVRYVIAAGFPAWRVSDSLHRSSLRNHARFEAMQIEYSLITRTRFEAEALAMCREHRLGFIARSPLAGGFLAKRPLSIRELINVDRNWSNERFGNSYGDAILTALAKVAERRTATSAQIALAWVLREPLVSSALVSPASPNELRELIQASDLRLTDDEAGTLANATRGQNFRMDLRHA